MNINEIIACTLDENYDDYENESILFRFNTTEEDLDSLEELLKDF